VNLQLLKILKIIKKKQVIARENVNHLKHNLRKCNIKNCKKCVTEEKNFKKLLNS
jgi:hypothetical protein